MKKCFKTNQFNENAYICRSCKYKKECKNQTKEDNVDIIECSIMQYFSERSLICKNCDFFDDCKKMRRRMKANENI